VKTRYIFSGALLFPLAIVIILAVTGITLNVWIYVILAVICPVAAGTIWYMFKDTERKMKKSR
jgi:general stress protein CsbA